jgi:predicted short-subunit dehydrogenase-like oxidoreductase (DUF2520 family)
LLPLVRGAVENVAAHGAGQALTGPIARGDAATVEKHLAALAEECPDALPLYRALAHATLDLARAHKILTPQAAAALEASLSNVPIPTRPGRRNGGDG